MIYLSFNDHLYFQILDEICRILSYVKNTQNLARAYKVTDELFDLSTMAMEYFKEAVEPGLPEISYFSSELQASLDALTSKGTHFIHGWKKQIIRYPSKSSSYLQVRGISAIK